MIDTTFLKIENAQTINTYSPNVVSLRCPQCRHVGAFHGYQNAPDLGWIHFESMKDGKRFHNPYMAGLRICPNNTCRSIVFVVTKNGQIITTYPREILDFNLDNLPPKILSSIQEALQCHASGCYRAAAIMVRRTLEDLCSDKGVKGKTLAERLKSLGSNVVLPAGLLAATDELRALGNDAAHVEAKDYNDIGEAESALALDLTKELLKAVYQLDDLLIRLQKLKKTNPK